MKTTGERERRQIDARTAGLCLEHRAGAEPRVRGHAAIFDSPAEIWTDYWEVVRPGAFAAELARADLDVVGLFNHDANYPLGRTVAGDLELWEDEAGLGFLLPGPWTATTRDLVIEPIRLGRVRGASFSFEVREERETRQKDGTYLRELLEVALFDVSPVTQPAYAATEVGLRTWAKNRVAQFSQPGHPLFAGTASAEARAKAERELYLATFGT